MSHKEMLNLALSLHGSSDVGRAIQLFEQIIEEYPESDSADLAKAHLFNLRNGRDDGDAGQGLSENESRVILTTSAGVPGFEVVKILEIVTSECVFGMNILFDLLVDLRDVVGGRSRSMQDSLRQARKECLAGLKREAALLGADAVIAVDLDYSEISGRGRGMLFVVASGTAVRLAQQDMKKGAGSVEV